MRQVAQAVSEKPRTFLLMSPKSASDAAGSHSCGEGIGLALFMIENEERMRRLFGEGFSPFRSGAEENWWSRPSCMK